MSDPFLAEIRIFGFNFAPRGWALCNGQLMPISQNTALFSLLGTNYGGDGKSTFGLPDLQGLAPMQQGQGQGLSSRVLGEQGGEPYVTLLTSEMPSHSHPAQGGGAEGQPAPVGNTWGAALKGHGSLYAPPGAGQVNMSFNAIGAAGGSQPHNNMPPYLTLNYCIALQGIFPPRG